MDKFDVQPDPWDNRIIVSSSAPERLVAALSTRLHVDSPLANPMVLSIFAGVEGGRTSALLCVADDDQESF